MMPVKLSDHAVAMSDCSRKRDRIRGNPRFPSVIVRVDGTTS